MPAFCNWMARPRPPKPAPMISTCNGTGWSGFLCIVLSHGYVHARPKARTVGRILERHSASRYGIVGQPVVKFGQDSKPCPNHPIGLRDAAPSACS
ncbi:hypothetical protein D3C81_1911580 [compost metagenome]